MHGANLLKRHDTTRPFLLLFERLQQAQQEVCATSTIRGFCFADNRDDWNLANSVCRAIGGRLCSLAEVELELTSGTGCGLDSSHIWTSDGCGEEDGLRGCKDEHGHANSCALPVVTSLYPSTCYCAANLHLSRFDWRTGHEFFVRSMCGLSYIQLHRPYSPPSRWLSPWPGHPSLSSRLGAIPGSTAVLCVCRRW